MTTDTVKVTAADVRKVREHKAATMTPATRKATKTATKKVATKTAKAGRKATKVAKAVRKAAAAKTPKVERKGLECSCGCGEVCGLGTAEKPKMFRQGHDAKLFSLFLKAAKDNTLLKTIKPISIERFSQLAKIAGDSRCQEVYAKIKIVEARKRAA